MWKRKINFVKGQTAEQRAYQEKSTRRSDRRRARMCDALKFWGVCATPLCRRRHACSGDPEACFETKWPIVPDEVKEWLRAARALRASGLSPQQAMQQAHAEVARVKEAEAAAQRALERAAAAPKPAAPPEIAPPAPRVRRL
jgi:hypothetical protein